MSRPSAFTPELGEQINQLIAKGKPLVRVCEELGLAYSTVRRWLKDDEQFARAHAQARKDQADTLFDEIIEIADSTHVTAPNGMLVPLASDQRMVQIKARQWVVGKLDPERFGDKTFVEHSGSIDLRVSDMSREDLILELQALANKGAPVPQTLLSAPIDAEFEDVTDLVAAEDDDWSDLA